MNNFYEKQNEKANLDLLKLQRFLYTKAGVLSLVYFFVCIVVPLILTIISRFSISTNYITYFNFLGAVLTIFAVFFVSVIRNVKTYSAKVQYAFDNLLFDLKHIEFDFTLDLNEMYMKAEGKKVQNQKGLENWYSNYSHLDTNKAIYYCQLSNIMWDKKLRNYYYLFIISISVIMALVIISLAIIRAVTLIEILSFIFLLLPIIVYIIQFSTTHKSNIKEQKELFIQCQQIRTKNKFQTLELQKLESKLFYYRKDLIKVPNFFFKIFKKNMQKEADDYAKIVK